jgi:hypothetical protein
MLAQGMLAYIVTPIDHEADTVMPPSNAMLAGWLRRLADAVSTEIERLPGTSAFVAD